MLNFKTIDSSDQKKNENILTELVIAAAIEVHKILGGPGLLESIYEEALIHELTLRNISVQSQIRVPVKYKNSILRETLRLDLLINNNLIVEVKATEKEVSVHRAQILTYLRLTGIKLGLIINFGQERLVDGLTRVRN